MTASSHLLRPKYTLDLSYRMEPHLSVLVQQLLGKAPVSVAITAPRTDHKQGKKQCNARAKGL